MEKCSITSEYPMLHRLVIDLHGCFCSTGCWSLADLGLEIRDLERYSRFLLSGLGILSWRDKAEKRLINRKSRRYAR